MEGVQDTVENRDVTGALLQWIPHWRVEFEQPSDLCQAVWQSQLPLWTLWTFLLLHGLRRTNTFKQYSFLVLD